MKWIKVGIEYGRNTDIHSNTTNQLLHVSEITFENVKAELNKYSPLLGGRRLYENPQFGNWAIFRRSTNRKTKTIFSRKNILFQ